jgi:GntR family transcriptional regulator / MocR family aminotransferase
LNALGRHLRDLVEVQGAASGLHLVVWFRALPASAEPALVQAARDHGVRVYPISPLFHPRAPGAVKRRPAGLVMGYALLEQEAIEEGVRRLAEVLVMAKRTNHRAC